eukprot:6474563-Alexandrium_andersonii.AAC.1
MSRSSRTRMRSPLSPRPHRFHHARQEATINPGVPRMLILSPKAVGLKNRSRYLKTCAGA